MFRLSYLLKYDSIVIQCHDNPDADALASAYAVYSYLKQSGKEVEIIYSGFEEISKCNLELLVEEIGIPIKFVKKLKKPPLLVCVDCQYGEGNVTRFEAETVVVIDHHLQTKKRYDFGVILSQLASCSTLIWDLLRKEKFDFIENNKVATALYYGLFSDTNSFSEISHPLDKDMRDGLSFDKDLLDRLRFTNLTLEELEIAGAALVQNSNNLDMRYALFQAEPCDPNILGFISDLGLQVNTVDVCIVFCQFSNGAKISIRSCVKEVMALEYVEYLTKGVGSGGGTQAKAGGFIQKEAIDALGMTISDYMHSKTSEYLDSFDVIVANSHQIDTSDMRRYRKKNVPIGYILSTDVFEEGTPIRIRTIQGDSQAKVSSDVYLMVGIKGEVYPVKSEKFQSYYTTSELPVKTNYAYMPTVKNEITGKVKNLLPFIKACVSLGERQTLIAPLIRNTKVFTPWNAEGYLYGGPGDYLGIKCDDLNDVYIIHKDVFEEMYEECQ